MRFVAEYVGAALLSVVVGGAVLYVFVNAPDSGLTQAGSLAEQKMTQMNRIGTEQTYSREEMDQRISFSYEEKTYVPGVYEKIADRFQAVDSKGNPVTVRIKKVISSSGEVCKSDENGAVFDKEGIYDVYVTANGTGYKVTVPVTEDTGPYQADTALGEE